MTTTTTSVPPMPSRPTRRDGQVTLPSPAERARLCRSWNLSPQQVATAFGVTPATVRSWESGRTSPTGLRRAAYAAFLNGLAHALTTAAPEEGAVQPPRPRTERTPAPATPITESLPAPASPPAAETTIAQLVVPTLRSLPTPAAALPVGGPPDPVSPARRRRFWILAASAGAWSVFTHLMLTTPLPHP
ncbi:helix-turn-helix domain-containing protein [Streptomyces sp. cg35]|uniref:helix-turn-helix domain-containing protein n=1 Tax=Streptomyces sp. cg35 TaxID=3421650 RepID=UPI003D163F85